MSDSNTVLVRLNVKTPMLPNFLRFQDGEGTIDIANVADASLEEVGKRWTKELLQHAAARRALLNRGPSETDVSAFQLCGKCGFKLALATMVYERDDRLFCSKACADA